MAGGDEVAMPAQDRVWTYQQPDLVQGLAGKPVEESRGQGSVGGGEANPVTVGVEPSSPIRAHRRGHSVRQAP